MLMGILGFKKIDSHVNISLARKLTPIRSNDIRLTSVIDDVNLLMEPLSV